MQLLLIMSEFISTLIDYIIISIACPLPWNIKLYYNILLQGIPYSHDMCPCITCFYPNTSCYDKCRTGKFDNYFSILCDCCHDIYCQRIHHALCITMKQLFNSLQTF